MIPTPHTNTQHSSRPNYFQITQFDLQLSGPWALQILFPLLASFSFSQIPLIFKISSQIFQQSSLGIHPMCWYRTLLKYSSPQTPINFSSSLIRIKLLKKKGPCPLFTMESIWPSPGLRSQKVLNKYVIKEWIMKTLSNQIISQACTQPNKMLSKLTFTQTYASIQSSSIQKYTLNGLITI